MSWLRLDDSIDGNEKLRKLGSDQRRFTWIRVLLFTARYGSDLIPDDIADFVPKATPAYLADCITIGLAERATDGTMRVHDWHDYNGHIAEQRERERDKKRRQRGRKTGQEGGQQGGQTGGQPRTRADLSPSPTPTSNEVLSPQNDVERAEVDSEERDRESNTSSLPGAVGELLERLGLNGAELREASQEPDRAAALARHVLADPGIRSPRAYFRTAWRSGEWPEGAGGNGARAARPLVDVCRGWVVNVGGVLEELDVLEELADREAQRGERLTDGERAGLLELWRSLQASP